MHLIRTLLIVVLAISALATAEIHRAKQVQKTKPVKSATLNEHEDSDYAFDSDLSKAGGHSRETWIYSLISATLVGLSGIFPLVVIPLEAGKGLKKGGEWCWSLWSLVMEIDIFHTVLNCWQILIFTSLTFPSS